MRNDDVNWTGWELDDNQFLEEFDAAARLRMIEGGRQFRSYLNKFSLGNNILEIGPFFTPTILKETLSKEQVLIYLENDKNVIQWLQTEQYQSNVFPIKYNIDNLGDACFVEKLPNELHTMKLDTVLFSQVLNYVDFVKTFRKIRPYLNANCKIFINNVANYGIPQYFHDKRPRNIKHIILTLLQLDFEIINLELKSPPRERDDNRLLVAMEYTPIGHQ